MPYLLDVAYLLALILFSPLLLVRAVRDGKYRAGFAEKLLGRVPRRDGERPCIWLHAVSVGEVNLLEPLIAMLKERRPEYELVLSTGTATGLALARKKYPALCTFYAPLDFSWAVHSAIARLRPSVLILAELELWPNLVRLANAGGVKVAIVNGRLSARSFRGYRRVRLLLAPVVRGIDVVAAQTEEYAERFIALGAPAERVHVSGSMKYDGARTSRDNAATRELAALARIGPDDFVWLAGSTQAPEEETVLAAFRSLSQTYPRLRLILVPRHRERFEAVATLLEQSGMAWQRRSTLDKVPIGVPLPRILLVDTIGELGAWWGTAHIAFVGGSLGSRGGQNMIEPAAYGAAICFGPNTRNFRDVVERLLASDAAEVVDNGAGLERFVARCLTEPGYASDLGQHAQALVKSQLGATERTYATLTPLLRIQHEIDVRPRACA